VEVVRRAAELRARGEARELELRLDGRFVRVKAYEVEQALADAQRELGLTRAARERFRTALVRRFYARYAELLGGLAIRDAEDVERALRRSGALKRVVDAAWPLVRAESVVRDLLATRARLAAAANGILEPEEQDRLLASRRRGRGWSVADVALLDEARSVVGDPPKRSGHVIVDEAQDLTPMQWRMVGRRGRTASWTIVGDPAQSSWPAPAESDAARARALEGKEVHAFHLSTNYRNSSEIYAYAAAYAERVGLDADLPTAVRSTGLGPREIEAGGDLEQTTRAAVSEIAGSVAGTVGIVVPAARRSMVNAWLASWPEHAGDARGARAAVDSSVPPSGEDRIVVLTGVDTKGLEFDGIVVVRPDEIEAESATGRATLDVVLTRATQVLTVVR
jgi:DNA helicase IV